MMKKACGVTSLLGTTSFAGYKLHQAELRRQADQALVNDFFKACRMQYALIVKAENDQKNLGNPPSRH